MKLNSRARRMLGLAASAALLGLLPLAPAMAQEASRLERIEAQLRALQRQVFPGGDQRFFEPEITPQQAATPDGGGGVSPSTLTQVLTRLDAIELQLARLTAATEVNENALAALEARLTALDGGPAAATTAAPAAAAPALAATTATPAPATTAPASTPAATRPALTPAPAATTAPAPTPAAAPATGPSAARLAAVRAILKPATTDAGDDEYTYGFRLWEAGFYPEAQQQLALFLERYPNHQRVTFGRNLLGRAFLDAGDPRRAATHFFENYQADKQAARAPDSLLFLAESMIRLEDTRRACIALAEFGETYPALATGRLKSQYDGLVGRVSCS